MKFRKKPVVIEAFQMTEARRIDNYQWPQWLHDAWNKERQSTGSLYPTEAGTDYGTVSIGTLEGPLLVSFEDWIIKGMMGEIYPCKPDIFKATYHDAGDDSTAQAIQTAPRVTPAELQDNIVSEHYFTAREGAKASDDPDGIGWLNNYPESLDLLTFCVLVLRNGFTVTGESACASPENFDSAIGRKIAYENAVAKIWPLMGYVLKERLYQEAQPSTAA